MFSSKNRLTAEIIERERAKRDTTLCRGVFAVEVDDCQCIGYDQICGVAMGFRAQHKSNTDAVYAAKKEVETNEYLKGFRDGWDSDSDDGPKRSPPNAEYDLGWDDGRAAVDSWEWTNMRLRTSAISR